MQQINRESLNAQPHIQEQDDEGHQGNAEGKRLPEFMAFLRFGFGLCIQVMPFMETAILLLSSSYSNISFRVLWFTCRGSLFFSLATVTNIMPRSSTQLLKDTQSPRGMESGSLLV